MGYFAFLDENNVVTEVIPGIDGLIEGLPPEEWYGNFRGQKCVRTSYTAEGHGFRGYYAGIGYTYDEVTNEFVPPYYPYVPEPIYPPTETE